MAGNRCSADFSRPILKLVNVTLTPEQEQLVKNQVASGRYHSESEVVQAALSLLVQQDDREAQLQRLRNRVDQGIASLRRGEGVDGEAFMQQLLAGLDSPDAKA